MTILLGLPDDAFARALRRALPAWRVEAAPDAVAARAALRAGPAPAFLLLDSDALGASAALALCRELRLAEARAGTPRAPIVLWMRKAAPRAVRAALAAGADDCRAPQPAATFAALLSTRVPPSAAPDGGLPPDDVRVDPRSGAVLLAGEPLALTSSEAAALRILVAWNGEPRTRAQLLRDLRGDDAGSVQPRSVDSLVADLRAKLGPAGWRLETSWGIGYRWNAAPARPGLRAAFAPEGRRRLLLAVLLGLLLAALAHRLARPDEPAPPAAIADAPAKAEDGEPGETEIASLPDGERGSRDTRPQPAWRGADPATPSPAARADMDPAVRALRPAFALPDGTPPAVGIAVRPDGDLLSRFSAPPDPSAP